MYITFEFIIIKFLEQNAYIVSIRKLTKKKRRKEINFTNLKTPNNYIVRLKP